MPTSSEEKEIDELSYIGSVTRYGPRNQLPAQGVKALFLGTRDLERIRIFLNGRMLRRFRHFC